MDTQTLRCFLRVIELGSFGKAAQVLNVSQPTLSRRIALLEQELGAPLFLRHQRGVTLTPAGQSLNTRAVGLIRQIDLLQDDVAALSRTPSGAVAIGLPPSLGSVFNGPLVEMVRRKYPQIRLYVHEGISNLVGDKLVDGELDLALMFRSRAPLRNIDVEVIATEGLVLATVPDSAPPGGGIEVADIAELPLVLYRQPNFIRWQIDLAFRKLDREPVIATETNTLSMLVEMARRGIGAAVLPGSAVAQDVADGRLAATPIRGLSVDWTLAVARDGAQVPAVRALIECTAHLLAGQIASGAWQAAPRARSGTDRPKGN